MNVAGEEDVGHAEYNPDISSPLFILATCPVETRPEGAPRLWGKLKIKIKPDTHSHRIYGQTEIEEPHSCNFELNPDYTETLEKYGGRIGGVKENGTAGIVEFPKNYFYITTGFLPQLACGENSRHPLITAYLEAARSYQKGKKA